MALAGNRIEDAHFILLRGSTIGDACRFNGFRRARIMPKIAALEPAHVPGTMPRAMNWLGLRAVQSRRASRQKELLMRNRILAVAAIIGAIGAPIAAQAQSGITTGVVRGGTVIVNDIDGIAVDQRPAFREYVIRERVPTYTIPDRVVVGGVLPEAGITYYDVPQTYGATTYRYTVVNGQTVLVEPRTRRIVQVVD
jgi:hypothetical protein